MVLYKLVSRIFFLPYFHDIQTFATHKVSMYVSMSQRQILSIGANEFI